MVVLFSNFLESKFRVIPMSTLSMSQTLLNQIAQRLKEPHLAKKGEVSVTLSANPRQMGGAAFTQLGKSS